MHLCSFIFPYQEGKETKREEDIICNSVMLLAPVRSLSHDLKRQS